MKKPSEAFIVSVAYVSDNTVDVLVVGKLLNNNQAPLIEVVNLFRGNEAKELFLKLTTVEKRIKE